MKDAIEPALETLDQDPAPLPGEPVRYYGDSGASIDPGNGESFQLIASDDPLRAGPDGAKRPIDLTLERSPAGFKPENPAVATTLPAGLEDRIGLGELGIRFPGAAGVAAERLGDEELFYPEAYQDTDVAVAALTTGVETFTQLRSAQSPETLALRIEMPEGAKLVEGPFGSAEVRRDDELIAWIHPPTAFDADRRPVEVRMSVRGDELILTVPHRAADPAYPIQVDPVAEYNWAGWPFGVPENYNNIFDWQWFENNPAFYNCGHGANCDWPGLWANIPDQLNVAAGHVARWYYRVPRWPNTTAYLQTADFYPVTYTRNGGLLTSPYVLMSLSSPSYYLSDPGYSRAIYVDVSNEGHLIENGPPNVPNTRGDAQQANFELAVNANGPVNRTRTAYLGGRRIGITDPERPGIDVDTSDAPGGWVEDASGTFVVFGHDPGLGVMRVSYTLGGFTLPGGVIQQRIDEDPCAPGFRPIRPCPADTTHSYDFDTRNAPQGINPASFFVEDPHPRDAGHQAFLYLDRTAPQLELSGGLWEQEEPTSFDLTVRAQDGRADDPIGVDDWQTARSGVKSLEILVDGERAFFDDRTRQECNGGAVWGSCDLTGSFILDPAIYGNGRHRITVIATDFLDHVARQTFERTIDSGPPRIVRVESSHAKRKLSPTVLESRWVDQEQVETMLFAADSGSGVKRFELRLPDNQTIAADGGCATDPSGGCPEYTGGTHGYATTNLPEGQVEASAFAFDNQERISPAVAVPFKVDHTNPILDGTRFNSSPLYQNRNNLIRGQSYPLNIAATDQHPSRPTAGVRSIEVLVEDGDGTSSVLKRRAFWDQPCAADSCPMERTFVFDTTHYPDTDQPLTVEVRITDAAGNRFTRAPFEVRITGPALPDPEHRLLGLEQFFSYDSTETGLSGAHVNLATGNLVWHSTPLINPGRGLSSVLNLTYNSFDYPEADVPALIDSRLLDLEYDEAGPGFSLGLSGITRLNEPLRFLDFNLQNIPAGIAGRVVMTDPDGTAHTFKLRALREPTDPDALFEYDAPPGVNLHLRRYSDLTGIQNGSVLPQDVEKAWAITRPDGITYFFDGLGFLRSIEDRNLRNVGSTRVGNRLVYEYENRTLQDDEPEQLPDLPCATVAPGLCEPRLARVIDAAGADGSAPAVERSIEIDYHPVAGAPASSAGRIAQVTDHGGRVLRFDYDAAGQLAKLTEAGIPGSIASTHAERDFEFRYAVPDGTAGVGNHLQLERVIDPRNRATIFAYSDDDLADTPHRRAQQITTRRQNARSYAYTGDLKDAGASTTTTVTDALGGTWGYELDPRDRPTRMTDALGTETELDWDTDNNVVGLTEAANFPDQAATTSFAYNGSGLLTSETDPLGRTTHLAYTDHPGMHRSLITVDGASIDADGAFVSDLTQIARPAGNAWGFTIQPGTASDGSPSLTGNVTVQTDPLGFRFRTSYRDNGTIGNEVDESDDKTVYRSYDPNGLPREVIDPEGFDLEQGETDAAGEEQRHRWLYGYDRVGNLTYATDPRGSTGHVPGGPAPPTFTTELTYDELDRLVSERVPKDSSTGSTPPAEKHISRSYIYDLNDNETRFVDGEGRTWKTEYTPMDRLDTDETPAGETTDYNYDPLDRLTLLTSPKGFVTAGSGDHATEFTYDAIGRRTATIERSSVETNLVTSFAYDRRDNVVGVADPRANYGASGAGAVANASNPAKQRLSMVYDRADQLTAELEDPDGEQILTEHIYDQNGNRRIVLTPRGFSEASDPAAYARITDYDERDMPIAEVDELGNTTSFTYGRDGKLLTETRPNGNATAVAGDFTTTYAYDRNDDLLERTIPWAEDQYGPRNWKVSYERNRVGDPTKITDARGSAFANSFYDTGELKTTGRPSWWQLDWGPGRQAPDPGVRFGAGRGGTEADMMGPVGGPAVVERPGAVADDPGSPPPTANASEPVAPGDFGRVKREQLPDMLPRKGVATFNYDNGMRLTRVTDDGDQARRVIYDDTGRIQEKIWPFELNPDNPISQTYAYDRNGNLTSFDDGSAARWTFEYDQFDRLTVERAPGAKSSASDTIDAERTTYGYDPNSNLINLITARGSASDFVYRYDAVDRLSEEQDPTGARWAYDYDAAGNRVSEISPRGNLAGADPAAFEAETVYDRANRPISITDPLGGETAVHYDANGNRIRIATPGGSTPDESDPAPRRTTITYDGRDLPWATTTGQGQGEERTTVTEFDANGNLRRVVNPAGTIDRLPRHADGSLGDASWNATVYQYDVHDQLVSTFLPWSNAGNPDVNGVNQGVQNARRFRQDRAYDGRGRLKSITYPYKFAGGTDPNEPKADRVCYEHYETGWIKSSTDPETIAVDENCDPGPGQFAPVVNYFYDKRGYQTRWQAVGQEDDREIRRDFYSNGTLAHREAERFCADPGDCEPRRGYDYFYNPNRSLVEFADLGDDASPDRRTLITRDRAERELAVDETWQAGRDTRNGYDIAGNLTTRRVDGDWDGSAYAGGTTTSFAYDVLERETKMTVDPPGDSTQDPQTQNRVTNSDYYPSGDLRERDKAFSGVIERYSYATDGRLERMTRDDTDDPADAGKDQRYAYDENGNRTRDERGTYLYNAREQLVRWTRAEGPDSDTAVSYVVNGSGAVTEKRDQAGPDTTYAYLADRLTSTKRGSDPRTLYDYNDFGSITCARLEGTGCGASTSITYAYDAFERRIGSSREQSPLEPEMTYRYDGLDRRDRKLTGTQVLDFAYVGTSELLSFQREEGDQTKRYDYDSRGARQGQTISGPTAGPQYRSYATDAQGSVEGLQSRSGAKLGDYDYDPYGELDQGEGQLAPELRENPFRFQGHYHDAGINTYDMQARTYAPQLGRFLSQDRYEAAGADLALQSDPLTQNRYVFAGANPVSRIEFDGHKPIDCVYCDATGAPTDNPNTAQDEAAGDVAPGSITETIPSGPAPHDYPAPTPAQVTAASPTPASPTPAPPQAAAPTPLTMGGALTQTTQTIGASVVDVAEEPFRIYGAGSNESEPATSDAMCGVAICFQNVAKNPYLVPQNLGEGFVEVAALAVCRAGAKACAALAKGVGKGLGKVGGLLGIGGDEAAQVVTKADDAASGGAARGGTLPRMAGGAPTPGEILRPGGKAIGEAGTTPGIRTVGSRQELDDLLRQLSTGGAPTRSSYPGTGYDLPGGGFVGLRESERFGPTLDVNIPDIDDISKIHLGG